MTPTTALRGTDRFWTRRRVVTTVCLLLAVGILVTPVQRYIAVRGLRRERRHGGRRTVHPAIASHSILPPGY
jgi:hypothetical protein